MSVVVFILGTGIGMGLILLLLPFWLYRLFGGKASMWKFYTSPVDF